MSLADFSSPNFWFRRWHWPVAFLLAASIFLIFAPALQFEFCIIDDYSKLVRNPIFRFFSLKQVFLGHGVEYIPLTYLSFALDGWLWGRGPAGYHAVNLLLHFLTTMLVLAFTLKVCPKHYLAAFLIALIFAIHPLHVEPVVWISCRKDLLYSFLLLVLLRS